MEPVIQFCKINAPYGCFSNFSPHAVIVDGTTWQTAEHYFQASKFIDSNVRYAIQMAPTPMIAAQIGRDRTNILRADWEEVKETIMRKVIQAKVMQHSDVRDTLLNTGDATLVEHTPRDSYWGDGPDGSGKNMLGKIYMEIRTQLIKYGQLAERESFPD